MIKKSFFITVIVGQFLFSCSTDDNSSDSTNNPVTTQSLSEQIADIVKLPYSSLSPEQQKTKLEFESNDFLTQLEKSKTSSAIEAIQNLADLLNTNAVDIFGGKNGNKIEDIIDVTGVYGIYTWDSNTKKWTKASSNTELKFIFPSKKGQTSNNTTFSSNSTSSNIKVKIRDTSGSWTYNANTNSSIFTPGKDDSIFLPTAVNATLSINNIQVAKIENISKYETGKETPIESAIKISLNDGYVYEMKGTRGNSNEASLNFSYNGKNLISFLSSSNAKIDELLAGNNLNTYKGKTNGIVQILDNFLVLEELNSEGMSNDTDALFKTLVAPDYFDPSYHSKSNAYNKAKTEGNVANYNKNVKTILVSKKDGTKIADIIQKVENGYSYIDYYTTLNSPTQSMPYTYWSYSPNNPIVIQYYEVKDYLRFKDNTEIEMSVYFSTGFDSLKTKFTDFSNSFKK